MVGIRTSQASDRLYYEALCIRGANELVRGGGHQGCAENKKFFFLFFQAGDNFVPFGR